LDQKDLLKRVKATIVAVGILDTPNKDKALNILAEIETELLKDEMENKVIKDSLSQLAQVSDVYYLPPIVDQINRYLADRR